MITGESRPVTKGGRRPGGRRDGVDRLVDPGPGRRGRRGDHAGRHPAPRGPGAGVEVAHAQVLADRAAALLFYVATAAAAVTAVVWLAHRRHRRGGRASRDRAGHLLPARPRPGDPADHLAVVGHRGPQRHPGQGPPRPRAEPNRRRLPVRQDRHPHQGRAHRGRRRRRRHRRRRGAAPRRRRRVRQRAPSGPRHRRRRRAAWPGRRRHRVPVDHRPWCGGGRSTASAYAVGGPALLRERSLTEPDELGDVGGTAGRTAAPPCSTSSAATTVVGGLALEDEIRPEAREAVARLQAMGRRVVMITGDARQVADAVGARPRRRRGVRRGPAGGQGRQGRRAPGPWAQGGDGRRRRQRRPRAGPGRRRHRHRRRHRRRHRVGRAHPGQLRPRAVVVGIVRLSKAAYRKSLQNLWWAAGYNVVAIPLAAGALSWAGVSMPPALAAVLMSVSTIVVAAQRPAPAAPRPATRRPRGSWPAHPTSGYRSTSHPTPGIHPVPTS